MITGVRDPRQDGGYPFEVFVLSSPRSVWSFSRSLGRHQGRSDSHVELFLILLTSGDTRRALRAEKRER
eukprot:765007-Hanusia_phi.AAC.4